MTSHVDWGRLELLRRTADDAYRIGRVDHALQGYRKALDLARELEAEAAVEDTISWVGTCLFNLGRAEECLSVLGELLQRLDGRQVEPDCHRARCSALKYWLWLSINWKGKLPYLRDMIARGRRHLGDVGLPAIEDSLLLFEGWIARFRGELPEAIALADRAVAANRDRASASSFVHNEYLRAAARFRLDAGQSDETVERLARDILTSDAASVPFIGEVRGHVVLARLALLRGRAAEALDQAIWADTAARRTTHKASQAEARMVLARAWLASGDLERAHGDVADARRLADEYHSDLVRYDVALAALEVLAPRLAEGWDSPEDARTAARRAAACARAIDARLETGHGEAEARRAWEARIAPELRRRGEPDAWPGTALP